jgi:hypothetical protein
MTDHTALEARFREILAQHADDPNKRGAWQNAIDMFHIVRAEAMREAAQIADAFDGAAAREIINHSLAQAPASQGVDNTAGTKFAPKAKPCS